MNSLRGFTSPRTPSGASSLVSAPPWHFSGEVTMLEYLADRRRLADLLPSPLEVGKDPRAAAIFGAWQSCGHDTSDICEPNRSQYMEFYFVIACEYHGAPYAHCPFCWVDKDFSLVRGLIQGYPKKLGSIAVSRPAVVGSGGTRLAENCCLFGTLCSGDRRLVELGVTLEQPSDNCPPLLATALVHRRIFPTWVPNGPAVDELVVSRSTNQQFANVWRGHGNLKLFPGPKDEILGLTPRGALSAYRLDFAETLVEGRTFGSI